MSIHTNFRFVKLYISVYIHNHNISRIFKRTTQTLPNKIVSTEQYNKQHQEKQFIKRNLILKLQNLLNISQSDIKDVFNRNQYIHKYSLQEVEDNYKLCIENGITKKTLQKYPAILFSDNTERKIKYMKLLSTNINLLAPVLLTEESLMRRIVNDLRSEENIVPHKNRIVYISKLLNLPETEVTEKIIEHLFVLRMPLDKLESTLKVLLEYGVEPKNIINDCWALRYSPKVAEERLKKALDANVSKVKTWMIRCPNSVFERCLNRQLENRKILGNNATVEEYLSQRLECSVENAKFITEKNPALLKMSILKMKEILDYLYGENYKAVHVCRVPRILIHSLETTKQRIEQLKKLGFLPTSLAILCKSKRDFDKALKKIKKIKKIADEIPIKAEEPEI